VGAVGGGSALFTGSGTAAALVASVAALCFFSLAVVSGGVLLQPSSGTKAKASEAESTKDWERSERGRRMLAGGIFRQENALRNAQSFPNKL